MDAERHFFIQRLFLDRIGEIQTGIGEMFEKGFSDEEKKALTFFVILSKNIIVICLG